MKSIPMPTFSTLKPVTHLSAVLTLLMLSGCTGMRAYNEGKKLIFNGYPDQGLHKLEEAVQAEPDNMEYKIALTTSRMAIINRYIAAGNRARLEGRLTDAEKAYRHVQVLDPDNAMAQRGLDSLVNQRRYRETFAEVEALLKKGTHADLLTALEKLRGVLLESPDLREALNLRARVNEAMSKEQTTEVKLAAAFHKPISLEFRDVPLKTVLDLVSQVSGLNFFYDKDIHPDLKVTVFAKNVTIDDAMHLLLVTNQLDQKVLNDNSIMIYPNTPQKQKDYQTLAIRTFYLTNADVKAVSNSIKTLVKTKDMIIDERLGIIMMRDTPDAIRMAEHIVALQDLSDPEVMLDVEVLEIKRSRILDLGIKWPSQMTLAPVSIAGAPITLDVLKHLTSTTVQATTDNMILNANKQDQDANILANPSIRVRNKEKAKIQIGDRVPEITTTSTSTGFVSNSVTYIDVGLKLEVEPTIYLNDEVAIKMGLEVSNIVNQIVSKDGTTSYQIGTRNANTTLRLKDGETQVLAGLISDNDSSTANKIPGLGDLPIAGHLFGNHNSDSERSEILLSITPHIVRSLQRPDSDIANFDSGTESDIGGQGLRLETIDPKELRAKEQTNKAKSSEPVVTATTLPITTASSSQSSDIDTSTPAAVVALGSPRLSWQSPSQVKVGEQFSTVLKINSESAITGLPLLVGFDPQVLQVVGVQEGSFFKQGNAKTIFASHVDPAQGKILITLVRPSEAGKNAAINGIGNLATVTFKAIKSASASTVQLLSATPEPSSEVPAPVLVDQNVSVVP